MTRLAAAAALELRIELRYRIVLVAAITTAVWTLALLALPGWLARGLGPFVLLVDTATFGALFIAALFLFERGEGALAALAVSPLRFGEYLAVKVMMLTGLSVASAVPIGLMAARGFTRLGMTVLAVALLSTLFLTLCFALVARHRSLTGFLTVAPLPLAPLIAVPLAHLAAVADTPILYLVPSTGAVDLIRLGVDPSVPVAPGRAAAAVVYLVLAIIVAALMARRSFEREFHRPGPTPGGRRRRVRPAHRARGWVAAFLLTDARITLRSTLLLVVLTGPVLLAVALRLGYPPLAGYAGSRFGIDLLAYQPIALASLVVLHVPLIVGMVGALLVLDDIDDRTLLVLRVTPLTLPHYLAYRSASVAALAMILLLATVSLSGLTRGQSLPTLLPALALAAAQAPLITLATAAFARNKVEGLAALKLLGVIPTGIAPAMWWLPTPAHLPLMMLPHYWTVDALWHPTPTGMLAGGVLTTVTTALLLRRTVTRLSR